MTGKTSLPVASPQVAAEINEEFLADVIGGLSQRPRTLPCKYFYDARGSDLFQKICELPEYYLTRAELQILAHYAGEMASAAGPRIELIGLGTGAGTKTRILLDKLQAPVAYVPVDISKEQLQRSTKLFRKIFPKLEILPVCADYLESVTLPTPSNKPARKVVYFPGSTIGNFEPDAARKFLRRISNYVDANGGLLIGVDLDKDRDLLERAYNDSMGVTAQFNLNLLVRANRELGADFDLKWWRHQAVYNSSEGRIEIYLLSETDQTVRIGERRFDFRRGEKITTEYSYKPTPERFIALARSAGFDFAQMWTDDGRLFGVFYFTVAD
ncbi:MAG TPA: L-histidine N(alpha)-methyltransferase [Chthoniobacterales bacterium]|jgi:dimethylhistidine N-methyltransferase|nr:L-histidine N(alpha)-methyltransferase [Chthoniobacterales bacterium]